MPNKLSHRREKPESDSSTPAWMITFSDLSTLLLTFFVLLLSMSSMDDKTLKSMFHNFSAGSGVLFFKEYGEIYRPKLALIEGLYENLKDAVVVRKADDAAAQGAPSTSEDRAEKTGTSLIVENFKGGFKLIFGHRLLFSVGSAEINENMLPVLEKIGTFMRNSDYQVYIDGHTDNLPMRSDKYSSNEELSLARAFSLMEHFIKEHKISPLSMALAGYGDLHPVDLNQTPEGRNKNRRVEIIFKSQKYF